MCRFMVLVCYDFMADMSGETLDNGWDSDWFEGKAMMPLWLAHICKTHHFLMNLLKIWFITDLMTLAILATQVLPPQKANVRDDLEGANTATHPELNLQSATIHTQYVWLVMENEGEHIKYGAILVVATFYLDWYFDSSSEMKIYGYIFALVHAHHLYIMVQICPFQNNPVILCSINNIPSDYLLIHKVYIKILEGK